MLGSSFLSFDRHDHSIKCYVKKELSRSVENRDAMRGRRGLRLESTFQTPYNLQPWMCSQKDTSSKASGSRPGQDDASFDDAAVEPINLFEIVVVEGNTQVNNKRTIVSYVLGLLKVAVIKFLHFLS